MLSFDVVEHGKPLQSRLRETPVPKGREVLVRVTHAGVCHSDLHLLHGYFDLGGGRKASLSDRGFKPPLTLGHEPLGIVEACGPEAKGVDVGDKRVVFPWIGCGTCWACLGEQSNLCATPKTIGLAIPGAFASHLLVPDAKFLVDVEGIEEAFAATLACSGVTSYSAVRKLPKLLPEDWVAVVGCGGVGLNAVSILCALGIQNIVACDIDDDKLNAAQSLGAAKTVRTDLVGSSDAITSITGARLAAALDFVGTPSTFGAVYPILRKGGRYILVGLHGGELRIAMPPIAQRAVSIVGSFVGDLSDLNAVVQLAKSGKLKVGPVSVRPSEEVNEALAELERGQIVGRTVLRFSVTPEGTKSRR